MPLKGIGKHHLFQAKPKAKPLVQYAHPEENPNDVHININVVDLGVMKELVNQWGEREPQPLANVDFRLIGEVHLPPDHFRIGYEMGARGRKGNTDLRGEEILPPKGICARLFDRFEPGNNTIGIHTRENFPGRRQQRG